MIQADDGAVGRNHNNIQPVNFQKFLSRSQGGTGHARELLVKSEIVLEGNRAGRTSFFFNFYPLFGLDGLMNPFRPASARLEPPGERIYNNNFSLLNHVIPVAFENSLRSDGCFQMMHVFYAFFGINVVYTK